MTNRLLKILEDGTTFGAKMRFRRTIDEYKSAGNLMHTYTYSSSRENLAKILDEANSGEIIEITRRGSEPSVVTSKAEFDAMFYNNAFEQIWNEHGESIKALADR